MALITIDGTEYETEDLSPEARKCIQALNFVENGLLKLRNELAVSDTARMTYRAALDAELSSNEPA